MIASVVEYDEKNMCMYPSRKNMISTEKNEVIIKEKRFLLLLASSS